MGPIKLKYCAKAGPPTTDLPVEELIRRGYRRISNAYGRVARIDRADWVQQLAIHLKRAPADFYKPGDSEPSGNWCDYYRSTLSEDEHTLDAERFRCMPSSGWQQDIYVFVEGDVVVNSEKRE